MNANTLSLPAGPDLPDIWLPAVRGQLATGENLLGWLELDLDAELRFAHGLIALTDRRLLSWGEAGGAARAWPLSAALELRHHDHAGVVNLELCDANQRLAQWRYTLNVNAQALRLLAQWEAQLHLLRHGAPEDSDEDETPCCPSCHNPLPPDQDDCPVCARELHTPPSTWTLLRLWRFARPYRWQLLGGFLLTLASTAATLVPPYLTMPLMDNVLIPFQNGKPIDWPLVGMYLGGLFGAAMVAWVLGWIRTYILSLVSERIGRDLRTQTYEHLLGLSLEYFGGKRTGDLMARIGNETDRINIFLSLDLLNFAPEKRQGDRFRAANEHNPQMNDKLNKPWSLCTPTVTLLTEIGLLVVWIFGIWQIAKGDSSVGVLTAFLAYIGRFYTRLDSMSRIVSAVQRAASSTKRIFDILDHVSSVPEPVNPVHLSGVTGRLELKKASFRYGTRAVTKDVDLEIQPGEMIGLVGHSGSGKSTLVNLICRFYDVSEGQVLIDGVDVRSVPVAEFRSHIGLVLQEPFLFFGTIADNIAYGKPNATRQEIIAAARAAHP